MLNTQVSQKKPTFYRRPLPDSCIAFSSEAGKKIFKEAIQHDPSYMESYFPLAEQFITQAEPAFCGLSTLAMCLNTLQIDPDRLWKGPWRWFSEDLLDCCVPLDQAKQTGIEFEEFICLAECNGLNVISKRADSAFSINEFREIVIKCCSSLTELLVLNYNRQTLRQTGTGHYSPVGGYHKQKDLVLLLDVARFKYPPHWVPLEIVYASLRDIDSSTSLPRGLFILSKKEDTFRPNILSINVGKFLCDCRRKTRQLLTKDLPDIVLTSNITSEVEAFNIVIKTLNERFAIKLIVTFPEEVTLDAHASILKTIYASIASTTLYSIIRGTTTRERPNIDIDMGEYSTEDYLISLTCFVLFSLPIDVWKNTGEYKQRIQQLLDVTKYEDLYGACMTTRSQLISICGLQKNRDSCCCSV